MTVHGANDGIRCPSCNSRMTSVYRTMKMSNVRIRRYRICGHCTKRFSSIEILDDKYSKEHEDNRKRKDPGDDEGFFVIED